MSDRRSQIVDSAASLIHHKGYQGTSIDDVLQATGVGKGNFYHYFRSKEELGYAVLDRFEAVVEDRVLGILGRTDLDPLSRIEAVFDASVAAARENGCCGGCPMGNLALELSDVHEGFRQRLEGMFVRIQSTIEGLIREMQQSLRAEVDPPRVAWFLVAALEGGILLSKVRKDPRVLDGTSAEVKRHLRSLLLSN